MIENAVTFFNSMTGKLSGVDTSCSTKTLAQLQQVFTDETARRQMPQDTLVYRVEAHLPVAEGKAGGLFFGTSYLSPGVVGNEYFMTRGHYHASRDTAEYYWCISGKGVLILMDEAGNCTAQQMEAGTLHYIPGRVAHRIANVGDTVLAVGACWPSDAGHDYESINRSGFTARLLCVEGEPRLVPEGGLKE